MTAMMMNEAIGLGLRGEVILVTPELAAQWLEHNDHNRPVHRHQVEQFKAAMRQGRFRLTHQGIAIDTNGDLQDGQNRLLAVVETGIAVPMLVYFDCPPENFNAIDMGARRTSSDLLSIRGYKNTAALAAVGRLAWNWERGNVSFGPSPDDEELAELLGRYPSIQNVDASNRLPGKEIAPTKLAFITYLANDGDFTEGLLAEDTDPTTPAGQYLLTLRERQAKHLRRNLRAEIGMFVRARNDHERQLKVSRKYSLRDAEGFPTPEWAPPIPFNVSSPVQEDD